MKNKHGMLKLFFISTLMVTPIFAENLSEANFYQKSDHRIKCAPRLQRHLKAIQALEEGRKLIDSIMLDGAIEIAVADNSVTQRFAACWDCESRTILIGLAANPTEGEIISSLLFELHNALMSPHLDNLDKMALNKKIDKQNYIRSVEHVEYMNSINASRIATLGVQKGSFPRDTRLHVYRDFDEYFYYQKKSGHSDIIGRNFEILMRNNWSRPS